MPDLPSARFLVTGRVQGVGFRWFVRTQAQMLGLAGSVRNLPEGSVEVVAAGDANALDRLEASLREGPAGAAVTAVVREAGPPVTGSSFVIR